MYCQHSSRSLDTINFGELLGQFRYSEIPKKGGNPLSYYESVLTFIYILLTVHLNIFIIILNNLMH